MQVVSGFLLYVLLCFYRSLPGTRVVRQACWLPFRPLLLAVWCLVFYAIPVSLVGVLLGNPVDINEIGTFAGFVTFGSLVAYWAPVAYFVRMFSGENVAVSWL